MEWTGSVKTPTSSLFIFRGFWLDFYLQIFTYTGFDHQLQVNFLSSRQNAHGSQQSLKKFWLLWVFSLHVWFFHRQKEKSHPFKVQLWSEWKILSILIKTAFFMCVKLRLQSSFFFLHFTRPWFPQTDVTYNLS